MARKQSALNAQLILHNTYSIPSFNEILTFVRIHQTRKHLEGIPPGLSIDLCNGGSLQLSHE